MTGSNSNQSEGWERQYDLASSRPEIDRAVSEVLEACAAHGYEESDTFAIRLSLEEAMANAMMHGNAGDESKRIQLNMFRIGP